VTLLAGCLPDYFPRKPLRGITEADVIGKWKLTRSAPPAASADDGEAEFFAGGHCRLRNFAHEDDESSGSYTWRIELDNTITRGSPVSVLEISGLGKPDHPLIARFYFTRLKGKLVFWENIGDPDSRNYLEYERI
jgi:hypothetical protein